VAVQSVANGDVVLEVSLSTVSGQPISLPSFVDVNVQAQWETAITVSIGALLLGVFGFGIWRNIAKRRKVRRSQSEEEDGAEPNEADPDEAAPTEIDPDEEQDDATPASATPADAPRD
jgi:hypothetical protein